MQIVIRSEDEAWTVLEAAMGGHGFPDDVTLAFDGWPSFELDVKGRDWHSTVPTRIMAPLLDVQKDINRAYAGIKYGELNLRKLKDEERDDLELVVKVKEGSSVFNADLWKQFSHMAEVAVGRMNGNQVVMTVLGVALMVAAPVMWRAWLAHRQRETEVQERISLSAQETERFRLMTEVVRAVPVLKPIGEDAQATDNRILKAIKPGDRISMKGVELPGDQVAVLVQPERENAADVSFNGIFTVLGNRTDKNEGFRITVRRASDDLTLNADVPMELPDDQKQLIQAAEWSKGKIVLSINASLLRETVSQAKVVSAQAYNPSN